MNKKTEREIPHVPFFAGMPSGKKILLIAILFFAFLSSHAQKATVVPLNNYQAHPSAELAAIEAKYYCCSKCEYTAIKEQPCPVHQLPLVKVGHYYCMVCGKYSSEKQGDCPEKHGQKIRMNMKYVILESPKDDKTGIK